MSGPSTRLNSPFGGERPEALVLSFGTRTSSEQLSVGVDVWAQQLSKKRLPPHPERPLPSAEAPQVTTAAIPKILPSVDVVWNSPASRNSRATQEEASIPIPRWEGISAMHDHTSDIPSLTKPPEQPLESKTATTAIRTTPVVLPSHGIISGDQGNA